MNHHTGWATAFDRIGFRYSQPEGDDAWARILALFARHVSRE